MHTRDWAGTVFVACLLGLAAFLSDSVAAPLLLLGAVVSGGVVIWDVRTHRTHEPDEIPPPIQAPASGSRPELDAESSEAETEPLLRRTPEELWRMIEDLTDMQAQGVIGPFLGRPMKVAGPVYSVGKWFGDFSQVTLERQDGRAVFLIFEEESWVPLLSELNKGDLITARGELERVTHVTLQLGKCKLVESEG